MIKAENVTIDLRHVVSLAKQAVGFVLTLSLDDFGSCLSSLSAMMRDRDRFLNVFRNRVQRCCAVNDVALVPLLLHRHSQQSLDKTRRTVFWHLAGQYIS